jgi:nitric oxide reductase NorD protein
MTSGEHRHIGQVRPAFEAEQHALGLYFRALSGQGCEILPYADDADLWQHPDTMTTLRLPAQPPLRDGDPVTDSDWYQVAVTHRALHRSLGTFDFDPGRSEPLFRRLRPAALDEPSPVPPLERFMALFGRTALAVEVFAALEDLRIDTVAGRIFGGLRDRFRAVQRAAVRGRPEPADLPPRAAVAEILVRISLGETGVVAAEALRAPIAAVAAAARALTDPRATVESTAEAAIRVYGVLAGLPNIGEAAGPLRDVSLAELAPAVDPDVSLFRRDLRLEGDELFDVRFVPVRYRDVPGPRYVGQMATGMPLQEAILRLTPDPYPEGEDADEHGFMERSLGAERAEADVPAVERPEAPPEPLPHDHGPDLSGGHDAAHGHLHATGRDEYVYPEWDDVAGRYLPDWCLVRTKRPRAVRSDATYRRTMARYGHLLPGLVSALERIQPAGRQFLRRMPSGDDLDLDASIEAMIDLRAGGMPSDRIYTSVSDDRREVAVAFAIDLSSSTAERVPPDPARPTEVMRILDVQRDAVSLMAQALDRIGDAYGVYGFSGAGRDDVALSVVKDLDERRSPAVMHRFEGLVPHHTTRMAPAIRHLTARLARFDAATRLLVVVSDGRPYDLDYGQQYGENAILRYALADTGAALEEARARGIRPYMITVDPAGGDYLGEICDPREYHVIAEPRDLPESLAQLYVVARSRA